MTYDEKWHLCKVTSAFAAEGKPEPVWEKIPEAKREQVRLNWLRAQVVEETGQWWLWGPQIPWYMAQPQYKVILL